MNIERIDAQSPNGVPVVILRLKGKRLGDACSELLRKEVNKVMGEQAGQKINLVLDMTEISFVNSVGLGEIVRVYTSISRHTGTFYGSAGKMKLLSLKKRVYDLLTITKLLTVFEAFENEAEALASFDRVPPDTCVSRI